MKRMTFRQVGLIAFLFVSAAGFAAAQNEPGKPTSTPAARPTPPIADEPIKVQTDLVTLTLTVHDSWGRYVSGLAKKHFSVFENGVEQEITFFSDTDAPASIGVIYDVSGSMGSGKIKAARTALERFMQTSHPMDEYSLIAFNGKVQLLADRRRGGEDLLDRVAMAEPRGSTAFYDAVYLGVDRVARGSHSKRALLVISDGQDNDSRYSYGELRRVLKETDVIIYCIGITDGTGSVDDAGEGFLRQVASSTGGKAFFPGSDGSLADIFDRIALELRHQYSIGYVPKDFRQDGKWRDLKVKISPPRGLPRLKVQTRKGYYATPAMPK